MNDISPHRRFRFRLQSLLLILVVLGVILGWLHYARQQEVVEAQLEDKVTRQEALLNVYRESEKRSGGYGTASPVLQRIPLENFLAKISGAKDRIRANEALRLSISQQKDAVPLLVELWRNGNEIQRYNALAVLNHIGRNGNRLDESAIIAFVEGTTSDNEMIRWKAISALGDTKTEWPLALEAVRRALVEDENPKLRIEAAKTHWVLTGDQRAVDIIVSFLDDPSIDVQRFALNAFHERAISREAGAKAVPILLTLVNHVDRDVRLGAIVALCDVGPHNKVTDILLGAATKDNDKHVRREASFLLRQIDANSPVTR